MMPAEAIDYLVSLGCEPADAAEFVELNWPPEPGKPCAYYTARPDGLGRRWFGTLEAAEFGRDFGERIFSVPFPLTEDV
jgi:hypothetical protein